MLARAAKSKCREGMIERVAVRWSQKNVECRKCTKDGWATTEDGNGIIRYGTGYSRRSFSTNYFTVIPTRLLLYHPFSLNLSMVEAEILSACFLSIECI